MPLQHERPRPRSRQPYRTCPPSPGPTSAFLPGVRHLNNGLTTTCQALLNVLQQGIQHHPKRISAAIAAVLLTGGGGAFAVAQLAPDPADLPVTTLTEPVASLASDLALPDLLEAPAFTLYRSAHVRRDDSAESLLQRLGIADPQASGFLRADALVRDNLLGRTGRQLTAEATDDHRLLRLTARWASDDSDDFQRLVVERASDGNFAARIESAPLNVGTRLAGGIIQSSLFAATDANAIPDSVAIQLAEIFSGEIDFRRALRKNDSFSIVYETLEADGEPLRTGRILSAEFHNNGTTHDAVWFQEAGSDKGSYYTLAGNSMRRAYLSTPVAFTRISSNFAMRLHPIHNTWRAHKGTDLAAPHGTTVRTIGDGVVDFAGWQNGYGNVVYVKHSNQHTTVYAHLSRVNVKKGARVTQGDQIGAVGATGWATGPHLHFEFRVDGQQVDPMQMARKSEAAKPISTAAQSAFKQVAQQMRIELNAAQTIVQAKAD